ncbi:MAG: lipocalin-like domain-containing protein [Dysgonamonadaceae bacterium]|jgi:hypothetical protein|nr:lipocalin-like domain-containing protein [Dysgonamonadaceae bacterium]
MKNLVLSGLLIPFLLTSCLDADTPNVDGLWQLKTIQTADKTAPVDTIYYSFMLKRYEFSYIILHDRSTEPDQASTRYGYVDFPTKTQMHILMDKNHGATSELLWSGMEVSYDIVKLSSREMILEDKAAVKYYFIKF